MFLIRFYASPMIRANWRSVVGRTDGQEMSLQECVRVRLSVYFGLARKSLSELT